MTPSQSSKTPGWGWLKLMRVLPEWTPRPVLRFVARKFWETVV